MMRHLLDEYGEMGRTAPAVPLDKASRSLMRARMHKLRGSAGALGAPEIQQLAATLEARLTVDDGGLGLEALLTRLSTAIGVLESSFEAWAASLPPPDAPITESQVPPDEAVTRLRLLLQDQDMEAVGWVRQCAKGLRGVLGATGHEEVAACVERLDFRRALELLDGSEQPRAVAVAHSA